MSKENLLTLEVSSIFWFAVGTYLLASSIINTSLEPAKLGAPLLLASFIAQYFLYRDFVKNEAKKEQERVREEEQYD